MQVSGYAFEYTLFRNIDQVVLPNCQVQELSIATILQLTTVIPELPLAVQTVEIDTPC